MYKFSYFRSEFLFKFVDSTEKKGSENQTDKDNSNVCVNMYNF